MVFSGKALLEVDGEEVMLKQDNLVMVEPKEKHFVKKILACPFRMLVINNIKDKNDKVVEKNK